MQIFTILGQKVDDQDDLFAIRDGFSFLGFLVPPFWFLWRGMWLHAGLSALAFICVSMIPVESLEFLLSLLIALFVGFEARFLHLEYLQRQGLHVLAQVNAPNSDMARDIYLAQLAKSPMKAAKPTENHAKNRSATQISPPQQADMIFGRS